MISTYDKIVINSINDIYNEIIKEYDIIKIETQRIILIRLYTLLSNDIFIKNFLIFDKEKNTFRFKKEYEKYIKSIFTKFTWRVNKRDIKIFRKIFNSNNNQIFAFPQKNYDSYSRDMKNQLIHTRYITFNKVFFSNNYLQVYEYIKGMNNIIIYYRGIYIIYLFLANEIQYDIFSSIIDKMKEYLYLINYIQL